MSQLLRDIMIVLSLCALDLFTQRMRFLRRFKMTKMFWGVCGRDPTDSPGLEFKNLAKPSVLHRSLGSTSVPQFRHLVYGAVGGENRP